MKYIKGLTDACLQIVHMCVWEITNIKSNMCVLGNTFKMCTPIMLKFCMNYIILAWLSILQQLVNSSKFAKNLKWSNHMDQFWWNLAWIYPLFQGCEEKKIGLKKIFFKLWERLNRVEGKGGGGNSQIGLQIINLMPSIYNEPQRSSTLNHRCTKVGNH